MSDPHRSSSRPRRPRGWLLVLGGLVVLALVYLLAQRFPAALESRDDWIDLVRLVGVLALVSSALLYFRLRPGAILRQGAVWVGVGLLLVLGYSYRYELAAVGDRLTGALLPARGANAGPGALAFEAGRGGHFFVEATVDGVPVRFLVDTGASDVVLRPEDARRLGFDISALRFDRVYRTANGSVRGAPVRLGEIAIGTYRLRGVRASVNAAPMDSSLLGLSFLNRLAGYEVRDGRLILRWR